MRSLAVILSGCLLVASASEYTVHELDAVVIEPNDGKSGLFA